MAVQIRYMGAKNKLAPAVASFVGQFPDGSFLDLFSGMCSVGGIVAKSGRAVWCNDIQAYSSLVAEALLLSKETPMKGSQMSFLLFPAFNRNLKKLSGRYAKALEQEHATLTQGNCKKFIGLTRDWGHVGNNQALLSEAKRLRKTPNQFPYRLCTITFSHGYFGLRQSIELDSLRYAIDFTRESRLISEDQRRWLLVGLLQTASHISSAPGHFAQFLKVRDDNSFRRVATLRRRSVWEQFITELERMEPYGEISWRQANRVFNEDAIGLSKKLKTAKNRPTVVYADPPYSKAQYSRYYHVLETLVKYDYPDAAANGRYRLDRYQTPFSNAGTVKVAFTQLVENVASTGAAFILSYPSNGLLVEKGYSVDALLKESFRSVQVKEIDYTHSTMGGGSRRKQTQDVKEMIYIASRTK